MATVTSVDGIFTEWGREEHNRRGFANATHIALGDSAATLDDTDTALNSEVIRAAIGSITYSGTQLIFEIMFDSTVAPGNTFKEVGIFDASSGGNMFFRGLTGAITVSAGEQIFVAITQTNANAT